MGRIPLTRRAVLAGLAASPALALPAIAEASADGTSHEAAFDAAVAALQAAVRRCHPGEEIAFMTPSSVGGGAPFTGVVWCRKEQTA